MDINGKGKAHAVFTLRDDNGNILKNQTFTYKMHNGFGEVEKSETLKTDENGIANIIWKTDSKSEVTNPTGKTITKNFIIDLYLCDSSELETTAPLKKPVEFTVNINPLSFTQEWEGIAKAALEAKLGAEVGGSAGFAKAKAGIASASVTGGFGTSMKVKNEYDNGRRNLILTDTFAPKIGEKISVGTKADLEVPGMEADLKLLNGKVGINKGYSTTVGQTITDYDPNNLSYTLDIGKFLLTCEALNSGNSFLLDLAELLDFNQCNYYAKNNNVALDAGAGLGKIDTTVFEGTVAAAGYNSSLNFIAAKDKEKNTNSRIFKKTAGISGKLGDVEIKTGDNTGLKGFGHSSTHGGMTTDYSFIKTTGAHGDNSITIKHMLGYDDTGLYFTNKSAKSEISYTYKGDEINKIKNDVGIIKRFDTGNPLFILESAAKSAYEDMEKSDAQADYIRTYTEGETYTIPFSIGAQLGAGLDADFELGTAYELSYDYETGRYKKGVTYVEAENDISEEVKANTMDFSTILVEPVKAVKKATEKFIKKVAKKVGETVQNGLATVVNKAGSVAKKGYKLVVSTIDDVKGIFSSKIICTYYIDDIEANDELIHMSAINDIDETLSILSGNAVTLGNAYIISIEEDKEDGKVLESFEDMPQDLIISYTDGMLKEAGVSAKDEENIDIYFYSEELYGYIPMNAALDTKNNCAEVEITHSGQYLLACTIEEEPEPEELPDKEGYGKITYVVGDDVKMPYYKQDYYRIGDKTKITAVPTRIGYQFCGWYTDTALKKKVKITKKTVGDLVLYPKWKGCSYVVQYMATPLDAYAKPIGKQSLKLDKVKGLKPPKEKKLEKAGVDTSMIGWTPAFTEKISGNKENVNVWLEEQKALGRNLEIVKAYYSSYSDSTTITYIDRDMYVGNYAFQTDLEKKCFGCISWTSKGKGYKGEIKLYPIYKEK